MAHLQYHLPYVCKPISTIVIFQYVPISNLPIFSQYVPIFTHMFSYVPYYYDIFPGVPNPAPAISWFPWFQERAGYAGDVYLLFQRLDTDTWIPKRASWKVTM